MGQWREKRDLTANGAEARNSNTAQFVDSPSMAAEWETAKPPASFTVFGVPDQEGERTRYALKIPWLMGLIATRSVDTPVVGKILWARSATEASSRSQ